MGSPGASRRGALFPPRAAQLLRTCRVSWPGPRTRPRRVRGSSAATLAPSERRPGAAPESGLIEDLPSRQLLRGLFHLLFGREPVLTDDGAYVKELESGALTPRQLVEWLVDSAEWSHAAPMTEFGPSLHYGRGVFIRSLPPRPADPRHRGRRGRRPLRRARADGLPVPVRRADHRGPPERGPPRPLPGRVPPRLGRDAAGPRDLPLPLHDRPELLSVGVVRPGVQRAEHRARHEAPGEQRPVAGAPGAAARWDPGPRHAQPPADPVAAGRLHRSRPQVRVLARRDGRHAPRDRLRDRAGRGHQLRRGIRRAGRLRRRGARHQTRRLRRDRGLLPARLRVPAPDRPRAHDAGTAGALAGGGPGGVRGRAARAARRWAARRRAPSSAG